MGTPMPLDEPNEPLDLKELGVSQGDLPLVVALKRLHVGILDLVELVLDYLLHVYGVCALRQDPTALEKLLSLKLHVRHRLCLVLAERLVKHLERLQPFESSLFGWLDLLYQWLDCDFSTSRPRGQRLIESASLRDVSVSLCQLL